MLHYQIIPVTSLQQNCSLLWCDQTNQAVLVDPGGEVDRLLLAVEKLGLELTAVWLTHGHLDHVGATAELIQRLGLPVLGPHQDDKYLIDGIPGQCPHFGFAPHESFVPDQWLKEGDHLQLGKESFSVLHTPGHTPGHIVIKHDAQKLLWVGDVLFKRAIGRSDFPRGDHQQLMASIHNKLLSLDDDYQFIPGHGPQSSIGEERLKNPYLQ